MMIEDIRAKIRGIAKADEPMSKHTTFGIGGTADVYIEPADADDLAAVMKWISDQQMPWFVLGDGANLLVSDKGIRGAVIRIGRQFAKVRIESGRVTVGSGAKLDKLVTTTVNDGLAGLESTAGIPGTVGGAIVMNAGTYRGQIGDIVESVSVVTCEGNRREMIQNDLQFSYRWSVFQAEKIGIIVEATLTLKPGDKEELVRTMNNIRNRRGVNLPSVGRSAGCIFKNPNDLSAGHLIEQAGLKGARIGDAVIADRHANFILNMGSATACDVLALAEKVKDTIKMKFDINLEYEVRIVGDW